MQVTLIDKNRQSRIADVCESSISDLKKLKGWKFNWLELAKSKDCKIFLIRTESIEALMKIEFVEPDFFELKNIEVSPANYGSKGKYINAAQILIAYACLLSFELNSGPYQGYLSFISKGELIDYYIKKYNAELVFRERMYINPINGMKLIKQHLNIEL